MSSIRRKEKSLFIDWFRGAQWQHVSSGNDESRQDLCRPCARTQSRHCHNRTSRWIYYLLFWIFFSFLIFLILFLYQLIVNYSAQLSFRHNIYYNLLLFYYYYTTIVVMLLLPLLRAGISSRWKGSLYSSYILTSSSILFRFKDAICRVQSTRWLTLFFLFWRNRRTKWRRWREEIRSGHRPST